MSYFSSANYHLMSSLGNFLGGAEDMVLKGGVGGLSGAETCAHKQPSSPASCAVWCLMAQYKNTLF